MGGRRPNIFDNQRGEDAARMSTQNRSSTTTSTACKLGAVEEELASI